MTHKIWLLCVSLSLMACHKFSKDFDSVAKTCGVEPERLRDARVLQISELDDDLRFVQAHIWKDQTWHKQDISPKGCVVLPDSDSAPVLIENTVRDEALWLAPTLPSPLFTRIRLQARKPYSMRFGCPGEGFAARDSIQLDAFYAGDGESRAGLWLGIFAESPTGETVTLHDAALQDAAFPAFVNLKNLAEGEWKVKARAGYRKAGQTLNDLDILGESQGCRLQVIRKIPSTPEIIPGTGLSEKPPRLTLPIAAPLVIARQSSLRLEACVETIQQNLASCEQPAACQDTAAYQNVENLSLTKPGLFGAYFRFRDPAGNLSPSSCATIQSSGSAPQFAVRWDREEWNRPFPLLEKPPIKILAHIEALHHDILSPEQLEATLECKLTMTSATGNSRPAHFGRCLSGRCAGQNFSDWLPCSPDLSIDMSQEWLRAENWESSINLQVRASDRVGHETIERKNLWFSGRSLSHTSVLIPGQKERITGSTLLQKRDRGFVVQTSGRLLYKTTNAVLSFDKDVDTMLAGRTATRVSLLEDAQGLHLWALWTFGTGTVLGKRTGTQWIFQPTPEQGGPGFSCDDLQSSPQGILCSAAQKLAILGVDQSWSLLPPLQCDGYLPNLGRYAETEAGRWWLCRENQLLFQKFDQTTWTPVVPPNRELSGYKTLAADHGDLWIMGDTGVFEDYHLYRVTKSGWEKVELPAPAVVEIRPMNRGDDALQLHLMADGRLRWGYQVYDSRLRQWQSLLPDGIRSQTGLVSDIDGGLWTIVDEKALLRFYPEPVLLPLEMVGVNPGGSIMGLALDGAGYWASFDLIGRIVIKGDAGLYNIQPTGWQSMAFGFNDHPAFGEKWVEGVKDASGSFIVRRENGDLTRLDERNGWSLFSIFNDRPSGLRDIQKMQPGKDELYFGDAQGDLWHVLGKTYEKLEGGLKHLLENAQTDADGLVWSVRSQADRPLTFYQLQSGRWQPVAISQLPEACEPTFGFVDRTKILLQCDHAPVLIDHGVATSLESLFPEIDFNKIYGYDIAPVADPASPWIFLSYYDRQGQILIRHDLRTGVHTSWSVPKESRLKMRDDTFGTHVIFDQISVHPQHPDDFLLRVTRFVLRSQGKALIVAADGTHMMQAQGIRPAPLSGKIKAFDIDPFGEVWLLIPDLGLVRFDGIWQSVDAEAAPAPL